MQSCMVNSCTKISKALRKKKQNKMEKLEKEPPAKRSKSVQSGSVTKIVTKAILSDELTREIDLITVWVSRIAQKKRISSLIQELCRLLPMSTCQHLKRVRQNEIIICKVEDVKNGLENVLKQRGLSPDAIACLCENSFQTQVPASSPKLRWQYEQMHKIWPCKFHSDSYLEALYAGTTFTERDTQFQAKIVQLLLDLSTDIESNGPVGICVDPRTCSIVAIAGSHSTLNPIMHCPLVLIDFVAHTQYAGAWNDQWQDEFLKDDDTQTSLTLQGISKKYYDYINQQYSRLGFEFGAESLGKKCTTPEDVTKLDNLAKYGPYLCTGYDVYLLTEPCLMCAMALVHSRTKRVYFVNRSHSNGALANKFKLHTVKDLNHHYEVFQCHVTT